MQSMHPIIALDLANDRARAHAAQAERSRLAALAGAGSPPQRPAPRPAGGRRAAAAVLRALEAASSGLAGSAGRAASRLEGGAA
jgi:hypothetical protein